MVGDLPYQGLFLALLRCRLSVIADDVVDCSIACVELHSRVCCTSQEDLFIRLCSLLPRARFDATVLQKERLHDRYAPQYFLKIRGRLLLEINSARKNPAV